VYRFRGIAHASLGKTEEARSDLQQAMTSDPASREQIKKYPMTSIWVFDFPRQEERIRQDCERVPVNQGMQSRFMKPALSQVCSLDSSFEKDIEDYAAGACRTIELWVGKLDTYLEHHREQDFRGCSSSMA